MLLYLTGSEELIKQITRILSRTVPTFVTAHTFCASEDTRVSCGWCLLIQGYFWRVLNYAEKAEISKFFRCTKIKLGVTMHFSEITFNLEKNAIHCFVFYFFLE